MHYLTLLVLLVTIGVLPAQDLDWKLKETREGMQIYTADVAQKGHIAIRVKMQSTASLSRLLAILDDLDSYPNWVPNCSGAERLPGGSTNRFHYRSLVQLPFPFRNRDVVALVHQTRQSDGRVVRKITATPNQVPEEKKYERIQSYRATWELTPVSGGTKIDLRVVSDTGSALPMWVIREVATNGPVKSLSGLTALAEAQ